jgi:hypothetical protein
MNTDRIDFISAYCDRWCERCTYTARCSAFAAEAAIAMCGDVEEGLELAVGRPHPAGPDPAPIPEWVADFENIEITEADQAEYDRRETARDARIDESPIVTIAGAYAALSHQWFAERYQHVIARTDDVLTDAAAIVMHDALFIAVKLRRALDGRDRSIHDDENDGEPIQNDWNGSAKVALISIERSAAAWLLIAEATGDEAPAILAAQLQELQREVEKTFPAAWSFIRPGFDEPGR